MGEDCDINFGCNVPSLSTCTNGKCECKAAYRPTSTGLIAKNRSIWSSARFIYPYRLRLPAGRPKYCFHLNLCSFAVMKAAQWSRSVQWAYYDQLIAQLVVFGVFGFYLSALVCCLSIPFYYVFNFSGRRKGKKSSSWRLLERINRSLLFAHFS